MCTGAMSSGEENYTLAVVPRADLCLGLSFQRSPLKISAAWFGNAALWPAVPVDEDESRTDWLLPKDTDKWMVKYLFTCQFVAFKEEADRKKLAWAWGVKRILAV